MPQITGKQGCFKTCPWGGPKYPPPPLVLPQAFMYYLQYDKPTRPENSCIHPCFVGIKLDFSGP